jgi:hypothetical protein
MALIFKSEEAPVQSGFSWDAWYAKNKTRLSEKRAKRYKEDTAYREAAKQRSRQQRELKKAPVVGAHTVSFNEAAEQVGVTVWVMREWRRKNYFPEPTRRDGRLWFSPPQVGLIRQLHVFFQQHGTRVTASTHAELDNTVNLVFANWN